jgi:hypothetical protein
MRHVLASVFAVSALLVVAPLGAAQAENRAAQGGKVLIESFLISGTRALDSAELAEITDSLSGSAFPDDPEELRARLLNLFQNRGFLRAEIEKLNIKVVDPLASPKPVSVEAEISEGMRYRLSAIEFSGNHSINSQDLRVNFPIKTGDLFKRSAIATGLRTLRNVYGSHGFLDTVSIPMTTFDSGSTVNLKIEVLEGQQYRMGMLETSGAPEIAVKLRSRWGLDPGTIFDASYIETFMEKNGSLLPEDFTQASGVALFKDCSAATVSVHFHLAPDSQHQALDRNKHTDCRPEEKEAE